MLLGLPLLWDVERAYFVYNDVREGKINILPDREELEAVSVNTTFSQVALSSFISRCPSFIIIKYPSSVPRLVTRSRNQVLKCTTCPSKFS